MGNIIELCAAKLYPDPKINLGFTMCITRKYRDIPEQSLIEDCALEHAIDIKALNECAAKEDGAYGISLLRDSVQRTADVSYNTPLPVPHWHLLVHVLTHIFPGRSHAQLHGPRRRGGLLHQRWRRVDPVPPWTRGQRPRHCD
jgi:hypothetical protein